MKKFNSLKLITLILTILPLSVDAALLTRLNGAAVYDTDRDLTWLTDGDYAFTSGYDDDGLMKWNEWVDWSNQLDVGGYSNWRLPTGGEGGCDSQPSYTTGSYNCTESELGHLFYEALGNSSYSGDPQNSYGLVNSGPFINLYRELYLTETIVTNYRDRDPDTNQQLLSHDVYFLHFNSGWQSDISTCEYTSSGSLNDGCAALYRSLAVTDGDVFISSVPLPPSLILFITGLISIAGITRKKLLNHNQC